MFGAWQYYDEDSGQWFTLTETMKRYGDATEIYFRPPFYLAGKYIRFMIYDERLENQGRLSKFVSRPINVAWPDPTYVANLVTAVRVVSLDGTKAEDNYEKAVPESNEVKAGEPLKVKSYDAVKKIEPTVDTSDIALYRKTLSFTYTNSRVSLIAAWQYFDDETGKWVCIEESDTNANADSGDARFVPDKDLAGKVIRYVLFDTRLDKAYCTNGLAVVNNPSSYTICAIGSPEEGGTISLLGGTYLNEHNVAVYLGDTVIVSAYPNTGYKFVNWTVTDLEHEFTEFEGCTNQEIGATLDTASHKSYYAHFKNVGVSKFASVKDLNGNDSVKEVYVAGKKVGENLTRGDHVNWSIKYNDGYEITKAELVSGSNRWNMAISKDETNKICTGALLVLEADEFSIEVTSEKAPVTPEAPETPETPETPSDPSDMFTDIGGVSAGVKKAIGWAVDNGIIKGFADGTFRPDAPTTREQFTIMLWRMAGKPVVEAENPFSDVDPSMSSYKAIMWAVDQGIIRGYDDGTFQPEGALQRNHIVIMVWRMLDRPEGTAEVNFPDVSPSDSVYKAVQWASENEIVRGFADGTFGPEEKCTRAQIVVILYRIVNRGFVTLP